MKRFILFLISLCLYTGLNAQPRGMGLRFGATGLEASYQHGINTRQFVQGDLGMDFGYNANGRPGIKCTATYNFIWARPAWTPKGTWSLYSGPGIALGFADDIVPYEIDGNISGYNDNGFMAGVVLNIGLEYTFEIPVSISLDVRPCFGVHINDGRLRLPATGLTVDYGSKAGFYDNGLLGFAPSLSIRYRF